MKKFLFGLSVLIVSLAFAGCNNVGPVVKYLKEINNEPARNWIAFLQKNGIDAIDENGDTILMIAAKNGNAEFVEACLKSKANVNLSSKYAMFPLTYAVLQDNREIADLLLKKGANPSPRFSENCIEKAISKGFGDMLDLLLTYKPDLDYRKTEVRLFIDGRSPPKAALLQKLENAGIKPSLQDLSTYADAYLYTDDEAEATAILGFITAHVKDPVYQGFLPNSRDNILTMQFNSISESDMKDAIALFKVLLDAGISATPDRSNYNFAYKDVQDLFQRNSSSPLYNDLVALFSQYGVTPKSL